MQNRKLISAALALGGLLLATGCQLWNAGGTTYTDAKGRFTVRAPAGWKYATKLGADFLASRDGPILQQILVEHREFKTALPNSKQVLTENLGAFELAEAVTGDLQADRSLLAFELKENAPAVIGGRDGFKITFTFRTEEKLRLSETIYGCISGKQLWLLRYRAPVRHYFERDYAIFEDTVKSFTFGKG